MPRSDEQVSRLLEAVAAISSDLSLPAVLRRIVVSACHLVDAQYAALGVLGPGTNNGAGPAHRVHHRGCR
jgi:hypothetical protein